MIINDKKESRELKSNHRELGQIEGGSHREKCLKINFIELIYQLLESLRSIDSRQRGTKRMLRAWIPSSADQKLCEDRNDLLQ